MAEDNNEDKKNEYIEDYTPSPEENNSWKGEAWAIGGLVVVGIIIVISLYFILQHFGVGDW